MIVHSSHHDRSLSVLSSDLEKLRNNGHVITNQSLPGHTISDLRYHDQPPSRLENFAANVCVTLGLHHIMPFMFDCQIKPEKRIGTATLLDKNGKILWANEPVLSKRKWFGPAFS